MQQLVQGPLEQARRDQLTFAMGVDVRQIERKVRTQERLGRGQGPITAEYQHACLDSAHSGFGDAVTP